MLQYKSIHKDSGYVSLYSTNDEEIRYEINSFIEALRMLSSRPNEVVYAYINDPKQSIYYKESNTMIAALFDRKNELSISGVYPSEVLLNEMALVLDNSDAQLQDKTVRPIPFSLPNLLPNDLSYIPLVVDRLLLGEKIAVIGRNIDHAKNFIKFVLYLFPVSFAKKVGFVINPSIMPNLFEMVFSSVKLIGVTDQYLNFDDVNLVVNLLQPAEEYTCVSEYAKILDFNKTSTMQLHRKSKELHGLFDQNGDFDFTRASKNLAPIIFEMDKTEENATKLIEIFTTMEKVSMSLFSPVVQFVIENELYSGSVAANIDKIIASNEELEAYAIIFKEKAINNYISNVKTLSRDLLDEVVSYFSLDEVELTDEAKALFLNQKNEQNTYNILFDLFAKTTNEAKRNFLVEFLDVDRNYDIKIYGNSINEFTIVKIFKYDEENAINLSAAFLYSTVLLENYDKNYSKIRRNDFVKKFLLRKDKISDLSFIFKLYKRIKDLIEINLPEEILDYHDFQLFDDNQLKDLIKFDRKSEEKQYFDLLQFTSEFDCSIYSKLQGKMLELVLTKDSSGVEYYKKYVNVYNLELFRKFFENNNTIIPDDVSKFIVALEQEKNTSEDLEEYRLDFIYRTYITSEVTIRRKIARKLNVAEDKHMDENIKKFIYCEEGKANPENIKRQKNTIDTIIDHVKRDDSITLTGKTSLFGRFFCLIIFACFFASVSFALFNVPTIVRSILLEISLIDSFKGISSFLTPYALLYAFVAFVISYFVSIYNDIYSTDFM